MILDELKILDSINLDFSNNTIKTINAKQTDTESRYVGVTCTEHGKKVVLNHETVGALIVCKKPDNFYVLNKCTVLEDGTVLIELTQQMLAVSGRAVAELILFGGVFDENVDISGLLVSDDETGNVTINGTNDVVETLHKLRISVLTTMSFFINILPSVLSDSKIESSYEFNALVDGLSTKFAIEQQMKALEDSIKEAEGLRVEAENNRDTAESIRDYNETTRQNAEKYRTQTFNTAIDNAKTATSNANNAYEDALSATQNANTATENANTKIDEMQDLITTFSQTVSGVIQDNESSNMTTYSSEKINSILSNKNYLVNSEFRYWCNDDETSFEINRSDGTIEQIKKWTIVNNTNFGDEENSITLTKNDSGGFSIECTNAIYAISGNISLYQKLNDSFFETFGGMDYVLTAKINGVISETHGIVPLNNATDEEKNIAKLNLQLTIVDSETLDYKTTVDFVKLELGTTSTSYIPRTYKEECDIWGKKKVLQAGRLYTGIYNNGYLYVDIPFASDFAYTIFPESDYNDLIVSLYYFETDCPIVDITLWSISNGQLVINVGTSWDITDTFLEIVFGQNWYVSDDSY